MNKINLNIFGATYDPTRTQIFSSGGGVQSTAIAALIVRGDLQKPDHSVIIDTEREKSTTWEYFNQVTKPALLGVGVKIVRIPKSWYATCDIVSCGKIAIPAYTSSSGSKGKLPTYCSNQWKKRVMQRWATISKDIKKAQTWIGFSIDEAKRALRMVKEKPGKWGVRFPLIELGMDRNDCLELVKSMGWPRPPRSSCWMCPNMHMREWRDVMSGPDRDNVIAFEREIRKLDHHVWLTDQCVPIDQADFSEKNMSMWGDSGAECESGNCFI